MDLSDRAPEGRDEDEQKRSAHRPARDASTPPGGAPDPDPLRHVAAELVTLEASPEARSLLAALLTAVLSAFTATHSVRDALPDTAPGTAEEALAVLAGIDQLRSSLGALDSLWQVRAADRIREADRSREAPEGEQGAGASHEIALARRVSPAASSRSLAGARRLAAHMPELLEKLWRGAVTDQQVTTVMRALDGADPATCAQIDDLLAAEPEVLDGAGCRRLGSEVRALVQQIEPERSRERAEQAARGRHVTLTPLADGMARLSAVLRAIDGVAVMNALDAGARSRRAAGSQTSHGALEADLLVESVLAGADHKDAGADREDAGALRRPRPGLDVGIVITDRALLARADGTECARIEGYGTLPAHIVVDTLEGHPPGHLSAGDLIEDEDDLDPDGTLTAFFRRLYTAPRSGELIAMESTARAFPTGLARMIRWRDATCRTPWCGARIRHIDHVTPVREGGPTSLDNGQGLCAACNLRKETGRMRVEPFSSPAGSSLTWSSPHGALGRSPTPRIIRQRAQRLDPAEDDEGA